MGSAAKRASITAKRQRRRERIEDHTPFLRVVHEETARRAPRAPKLKPFSPLTDAQADYADSIDFNTYTFASGPAGTGKTHVAAAKAAEHLVADVNNKLLLTRPAVEAAGEKLGFLPGDLAEKFGPYMKPFMKALIRCMGEGAVECMVKNGRIECCPLAFMRGEDYEDTLIIGDEMQNATQAQFKMFLTRLGKGSRMIIDGDPTQSDIGNDSGLEDAMRRLRSLGRVGIVRFTKADIVRHDMTAAIIAAYEYRGPSLISSVSPD